MKDTGPKRWNLLYLKDLRSYKQCPHHDHVNSTEKCIKKLIKCLIYKFRAAYYTSTVEERSRNWAEGILVASYFFFFYSLFFILFLFRGSKLCISASIQICTLLFWSCFIKFLIMKCREILNSQFHL